MNKFYVIFPVVLLLTFGIYYTQIAKPEMAEQERAAAKKVEQQQAADEARRKEIELKAQVDARLSNKRESCGTTRNRKKPGATGKTRIARSPRIPPSTKTWPPP